ncbi:MAG: nickel-dependent hydrogenase large subunit [Halopseudomonas sp.]
MSKLIVGPFNRVEGDLEVKLDIAGGQVEQAWVNCTLYRGFEQMLRGKRPEDALIYVPRICGICSVSQSVASAKALAELAGASAPRNGQLATNLILGCENITDHLTHFYLFFMPDFARQSYADNAWFGDVESRFKAVKGTGSRDFLPARAAFLHMMGILAGKWPHSLAIQPGGVSKPVQSQERLQLISMIQGLRRFLEQVAFGDRLESVSELDSADALMRWAQDHRDSDFGRFLMLGDRLRLDQLGQGGDRFMSYGNYPLDGAPLYRSGVWHAGQIMALDNQQILEDVSHSWMAPSPQPLAPLDGETLPDLSNPDGYSWCKAPRLNGHTVEVGALARQLIDRQPLAQSLVAEAGANVYSREVMRLLEAARTLLAMESWARQLQPGEPFYQPVEIPDHGIGVGMIEAARGSLGHWLQVKDGRIHNYQIIAPTTWNFSPRDQQQQPGPLEQALQGTPVVTGETDPVSVQHVVRSFDPCMVCTVH